MKIFTTIFALVLPFALHAQTEELTYFSGKDPDLVGVRTSNGKVVIPPKYGHLFSYEDEKITGNEILLMDAAEKNHDSMKFDYRMKIFDRKGKFLYSPYWVDNGPDYYEEGVRRFVEKGKMGFVDRKGKKTVPAKYNYLEPYYRGYAIACLDCRYTRFTNNEEHCCGYTGSKYSIIDKDGKSVYSLKANKDFQLSDSLLTALKLVKPYNAKEKAIVKTIENIAEVKHYTRHNTGKFAVVIAERPKNATGFYLINFRTLNGDSGDELSFLINSSKKSIFYLDRLGNQETLKEWRKGK
jgi:WG repeat protein